MKKELIEKLISKPYEFSENDLNQLLERVSKKDLKDILLRLFDKNQELNNSDADKSFLGKLNKKSQEKRAKEFWKRIKKRNISKVILAEGDSWFEYPKFISEIIDHLNKNKNYAIYSHAYGGDWISNILYESQYIENLSLLKPDVFLISGGGNDLVGGRRLALLLNKRSEIIVPEGIDLSSHEGKLEFSKIALNNEFFSLIKLFKLQYKLLFKQISLNSKNPKKFKNLKIITQGYDYAIPTSKRGFGLNPFKLLKPLTNWFMNNGQWLNEPILLRQYRERLEKEAIVYGMIDFFNEILVELSIEFDNVYHIDSRNSVNKKKGWYNELHPTSKEFKKISSIYKRCIESDDKSKKVYVVEQEY